jgi:CDGSH-type Zn-finger protein
VIKKIKMKNNSNNTQKEYKIKITKNGPYIASGGIPLSEQLICVDSNEECHGWKEGKKHRAQEKYALCRCGHSQTKPFCDGSHINVKFDGNETATHKTYMEQARKFEGPGLDLTDVKDFCVTARFCHRDGGTWKLTHQSADPKAKQTAIEEASDCPSGRLVAWEKNGTVIEPDLKPSIGLVEDIQTGKMGPIWVRGGIPVESADGKTYETRNRVTLCRCGKSTNKPFCDGSHLK